MSSLLPGYEYDIFISYRHNDNRSGWVTEFVKHLQEELSATIKDPISVYFDSNPYDGLLETHHVDKSLEGKLKCLIFIPILSQTYCDPKSFAWQHEFCVFNKQAQADSFGRDIRLNSGNVTSRLLPIKIHDLDPTDKSIIETEIGGALRAIEFIYKEPGVNRPLKASDSKAENQNKTDYRNQVNKAANAIKEIIFGMKAPAIPSSKGAQRKADLSILKSNRIRKSIITAIVLLLVVFLSGYYFYPKLISPAEQKMEKSIAVLPFVNLSSDPEQQYFADGLSEEIINALTQIPELKVIASTSSFLIKGDEADYHAVGLKLGVAHILKGTVRRNKGSVRVIAQLISAVDGSNRWSKTIDNASGEMIPVQEEIARSVASHFKATLYPSIRKAEWNETALRLYRLGLFTHNRNATGDRKKANELFAQALTYDSTKAILWALVSIYYDDVDTTTVRFDRCIQTALRLDSTLAEAYTIRSRHFRTNLRFAEAVRDTEKALHYGGSLPMVLRVAGNTFCRLGEFDEAIRLGRKAVDLDPLQAISYKQLGETLLYAGRSDEAIQELRKGLELSPDLLFANSDLAMAYLLDGKPDEAINANRLENNESYQAAMNVAITFASGDKLEAEKLYQELEKKYGNINPILVATTAGYLNNKDDCFKWLERASKNRDSGLTELKAHPFLASIRNDTRYFELLKRLKFP